MELGLGFWMFPCPVTGVGHCRLGMGGAGNQKPGDVENRIDVFQVEDPICQRSNSWSRENRLCQPAKLGNHVVAAHGIFCDAFDDGDASLQDGAAVEVDSYDVDTGRRDGVIHHHPNPLTPRTDIGIADTLVRELIRASLAA